MSDMLSSPPPEMSNVGGPGHAGEAEKNIESAKPPLDGLEHAGDVEKNMESSELPLNGPQMPFEGDESEVLDESKCATTAVASVATSATPSKAPSPAPSMTFSKVGGGEMLHQAVFLPNKHGSKITRYLARMAHHRLWKREQRLTHSRQLLLIVPKVIRYYLCGKPSGSAMLHGQSFRCSGSHGCRERNLGKSYGRSPFQAGKFCELGI